jgi:hypothetical protein
MKFSVAFKSIVRLESFILLSIVAWAAVARAEAPVYRCGNEYVASIKDSKNGGCKLMEGGNFINTYPPRTSAANTANAPVKVASSSPQSSSSTSPRNDSAEQKARDSDARGILESELKKAEAKQAELLKEYNKGEPERSALDIKNPQRYVDRLAEMKADIARNESDIAGIKRELGRNQGSTPRSN